ncbi:MAG: hypothetical protein RL398_2217 [Planctomycetota bacterium]
MERISITVSQDGLTATAKVVPGPALTPELFDKAMRDAGITHGVDTDTVLRTLAAAGDPSWKGEAVVARGIPAKAGDDGVLELVVKPGIVPGQVHGDGSIDFRERNLLQPVKSGDELAVVRPSTRGVPGVDVRGRPVPAKPGAAVKFRLGPGAELVGDTVVAKRDGVLLKDGSKIDVTKLYVHRGDVDLKSGNLHSEDSIEVLGDLQDNSIVEAVGQVVVRGSAFAAKIRAESNVDVAHGIMGSCDVQAGGDIHCRHAVSAFLRAEHDILVGDQMTHCEAVGERIEVKTGRARTLGGKLRARKSIEVGTVGTAEGAATLLSVADLLDERANLARLDAEAARATKSLARADTGRSGGMKGSRIAQRADDRSETERLRLVARQRELLSAAVITVVGTAHPGVTIRLGDRSLTIDETRRHVRFRYDRTTDRIVEEQLP